MSSALEEKMAVWRLIEQHLGNELRPVKASRPDCRGDVRRQLLLFMTFSKTDQLFYDLNDSDITEWSASYKQAFVVFVLGRSDDVLIVPIREMAAKLHAQYRRSEGGNYKLHVQEFRGERIRFIT